MYKVRVKKELLKKLTNEAFEKWKNILLNKEEKVNGKEKREKEATERRLELEKDFVSKIESVQKLKAELTRAIMEYKNKK